jgi:hypothetical protein
MIAAHYAATLYAYEDEAGHGAAQTAHQDA